MNIDKQISWNIIDKYFKTDANILVKHHLDSYNKFFQSDIKNIFREKNPIKILNEYDETSDEYKYKLEIYMGGYNGDKIYYGKPIIYDQDRVHYMYPNEARLRNMTYGVTIYYDLDVDVITNGKKVSSTINRILLGNFPIMLQSKLCVLSDLNTEVRYHMGECRNDYGGYFIIDGKEKVIVPQEVFANNMLYVRKKIDDIYNYSVEIRSVSEDSSKPIRTFGLKMIIPKKDKTNNQIVAFIPNVNLPIPLFILMRALGIESDKEIIQHCILDLDKNSDYLELFVPSIHDANEIYTQSQALQYIAQFTKEKTVLNVMFILSDYLLVHIGELNFKQKAYFVGYMVKNLLDVSTGQRDETDRDSFKYKRIELAGDLIYNLFNDYYNLQYKNIINIINTEYKQNNLIYQDENFKNLLPINTSNIFRERIIEDGIRNGFKGDWGAFPENKKYGLVQDLNRLSYNSFLSQLRKLNLPIDSSAKITKPRLLHSTQWGFIDPVDTPDGGNVGVHKHLAISAQITLGQSKTQIVEWLKEHQFLISLEETYPEKIYHSTRLFVNGLWIGICENPVQLTQQFKMYRRRGLINIYISIEWNIQENNIYIYTDSGRLTRPLYFIKEHMISYNDYIDQIQENKYQWLDLIMGFNPRNNDHVDINNYVVADVQTLYKTHIIEELHDSIIEYIDTAEEESCYISTTKPESPHHFTHVEIHPSLIFGIMGNQVIFPENNPLPRDLFFCGQAKQAVSLYHTNFQSRFDKMSIMLNYGQTPIVKSKYLNYINKEQHPYGENVIVAIMVYGGYNVEDSILFNSASVDRGLFRTTYLRTYESKEENSKTDKIYIDSHFKNIENHNVIHLKPGYDYSKLNKHGLIEENTVLDDKTVLIGKVIVDHEDPSKLTDSSVYTKKGQRGFVDKTFMTEGNLGERIAKVRIREERIPDIGDKFCSRCGQKGTVGIIVPEEDMPFTKDGIRPDIIVNPHAFPSRMTIGQLIETLMGKTSILHGTFSEGTAFENNGPKHAIFGKLLSQKGFHSSGNEILYNGITGEQLESEIFIGPSYYMRLKHMVKDKINYRALGPRVQLTRQTVSGRANDGGLRIGEMERDSIIGSGVAKFLNESLMVRGDEYYMAICNQTGSIAIYNADLNLFLSPMVDGPIQFVGNVENNINIQNVSKHGRSFSIVRVPYAFKLLLQELQTMNIQMRIITDDNVKQLDQLSSYSVDLNLKK